jgi:hypothetical protein
MLRPKSRASFDIWRAGFLCVRGAGVPVFYAADACKAAKRTENNQRSNGLVIFFANKRFARVDWS